MTCATLIARLLDVAIWHQCGHCACAGVGYRPKSTLQIPGAI